MGNLPIRHIYRLNPPSPDRDNPRNNDPPTLRPENRPKKKQRIHAHVSAPTPATITAPAVATVGDHLLQNALQLLLEPGNLPVTMAYLHALLSIITYDPGPTMKITS